MNSKQRLIFASMLRLPAICPYSIATPKLKHRYASVASTASNSANRLSLKGLACLCGRYQFVF